MDVKSIMNNEHVKNLTNILKDIGERVEGNLICDVKPDNYIIRRSIRKIKNLQHLCQRKKIIEIGVNACHSLLLMLLVNPNAEYLLFDLGNHKYTSHTFNYIKEKFPNAKLNIIYGNSVDTISKYIKDNPNDTKSYDLIHIDGSHMEDVFSHDYINSKKLIRKDGIVIFDDYQLRNIKKFIDRKINQNEITKIRSKNLNDNPFHFIYFYNE